MGQRIHRLRKCQKSGFTLGEIRSIGVTNGSAEFPSWEIRLENITKKREELKRIFNKFEENVYENTIDAFQSEDLLHSS